MDARVFLTRKRLLTVLIILACLFLALIVRDGYWSMARGAELKSEAEDQWVSDFTIPAQRGTIMDRDGNVLAQSASADSVVFLPQDILDPQLVASQLSVILDMDEQELLTKASTKTRTTSSGETRDIIEVWVKRQISSEQSDQIEKLNLAGVKLTDDVRRYYPNRELASQVIGYTTMDGDGQTGIERRFNASLQGRQGRVVAETDKMHNEIPNGQEMTIEPVDGENVVLTIDAVIQNALEQACQDTYEATGAQSVEGTIIDISTREILGMANVPSFDLNNPPRSNSEELSRLSQNLVVARAYEPGDLFVFFTGAAASDADILESSYVCNGAEVIDGAEISCPQAHGTQTFAEAMQNECVVVAGQMASKMGKQSFYSYLEAFGFGKRSGGEFAGESTGTVMDMKYASEEELAKMGSGHSIQMTQLQLLNAMASLLDGGETKTPLIVSELQTRSGDPKEVFETEQTGLSVGGSTAQKMTEILSETESVSSKYSGGAISAVTLQPREGLDNPVNRVVSMCMAFAPADDPAYLVLVTLNGESESTITEAAARSCAGEIIDSLMQYRQVRPDGTLGAEETAEPSASPTPQTGPVTVPRVVGLTFEEATQLLEENGLTYRADGTGTVEGQRPYAGDEVERGSAIRLEMSERAAEEVKHLSTRGQTTVPDFTGMDFEEAMEAAAQAGLIFLAQGTGEAVLQSPVAGAVVERGTSVTVTFRLDLD